MAAKEDQAAGTDFVTRIYWDAALGYVTKWENEGLAGVGKCLIDTYDPRVTTLRDMFVKAHEAGLGVSLRHARYTEALYIRLCLADEKVRPIVISFDEQTQARVKELEAEVERLKVRLEEARGQRCATCRGSHESWTPCTEPDGSRHGP